MSGVRVPPPASGSGSRPSFTSNLSENLPGKRSRNGPEARSSSGPAASGCSRSRRAPPSRCLPCRRSRVRVPSAALTEGPGIPGLSSDSDWRRARLGRTLSRLFVPTSGRNVHRPGPAQRWIRAGQPYGAATTLCRAGPRPRTHSASRCVSHRCCCSSRAGARCAVVTVPQSAANEESHPGSARIAVRSGSMPCAESFPTPTGRAVTRSAGEQRVRRTRRAQGPLGAGPRDQ